MMTRLRSRGLATSLCGTVILTAWAVACAPPLDSQRIKKSNLDPIQDQNTTSFRANTESVGALQVTAMKMASILEPDLATSTAEAGTTSSNGPETIDASVPDLNPVHGGGNESVSSTEVLDECFVPEICIDQYLWMLYQRTPKLDTIKVVDEQKVTVTKDDKTRTIIKKVTKLVNEDFTWKDPRRQKRQAYR